jgi:integrase
MKIIKVYRKDLNQHRWKIDITIDGKRIRRADFTTKQEALDAIAALLTASRAVRYGLITPRPRITLATLKEKCDKDRMLKARPRTLQIFQGFVELIKPEMQLTDLTRADWKRYTDALRDRDCKPGTINRYMAEISSILSSAPERFPDLGEWRPPKIPWLTYPPGRTRVLSREEISKILLALRSERQHYEQYFSVKNRVEVLDLFRLMLLTGAREGEILSLRQDQISWDWRTVKIVSKKGGGSVRVVPLSDSALEILRSRNQGPRFFSINRDKLYRTLERIGDMSGVAYGDNVASGWVIYDLRHVSATVMENASIPYSAVSAILGHKRKDQTATYAHAQLDTLRRAIDVLENYCRDIDGFLSEKSAKSGQAGAISQQAFG